MHPIEIKALREHLVNDLGVDSVTVANCKDAHLQSLYERAFYDKYGPHTSDCSDPCPHDSFVSV